MYLVPGLVCLCIVVSLFILSCLSRSLSFLFSDSWRRRRHGKKNSLRRRARTCWPSLLSAFVAILLKTLLLLLCYLKKRPKRKKKAGALLRTTTTVLWAHNRYGIKDAALGLAGWLRMRRFTCLICCLPEPLLYTLVRRRWRRVLLPGISNAQL